MFSEPVPADLSELDRRIMIAKVFYASRGLDWSFWVCNDMLDPSILAGAKRAFERRGLRRSSHCPGMLADGILPVSRELPPVDCRRVLDAETRLTFCHLITNIFRLPFAIASGMYNNERTWENALVGWVGYLDNQAVATSATVTSDGAVGLYSVGTMPVYRGLGVAELMTRHALARAHDVTGIERTVLQSTSHSHPLYERLGYRTVTRFTIYTHQ
jgi:GNAT superfamily N-acetyltransferase